MKTSLLTLALAFASISSVYAGTAFLKYERVSGMNKICVYDHLGSDVAITIKAYQLCPLTIDV